MSTTILPNPQGNANCGECWASAILDAGRSMGEAEVSGQKERAYRLRLAADWLKQMRDEGEPFPGHASHS